MPYGEIVTRSFRIAWRNRYLWLLALLAGEGAASGTPGAGGAPGPGAGGGTSAGDNSPPALGDLSETVTTWIGDHLVLVVGAATILILLGLLFFLVSSVAGGAIVRASAEHDAERPFGLGPAWTAGRSRFSVVLVLRLLLLLFGLVALGLLLLAAVAGLRAFLNGDGAGVAAAVSLGGLLVLALFPIGIVVDVVYRLAVRAAVLELAGPAPALGRAVDLIRQRPGPVALTWLIYLGMGLAAGILVAVVIVALAIPLAVLVFFAWLVARLAGVLVLGVPAVLVLFAAVLVASGAAGSYLSTLWTVAFRRLQALQPLA